MNQSLDFGPLPHILLFLRCLFWEFMQSAFFSNLCIVMSEGKEEMDRRMCRALLTEISKWLVILVFIYYGILLCFCMECVSIFNEFEKFFNMEK